MEATITLTSEQETALSLIIRWFDSPERLMVLEGFAGTGKTTLTSLIVDRLMAEGKRIAVTAPTHKAVSVLANKIPNAQLSTIHSLLQLRLKEKADGSATCEATDPNFVLLGTDLLVVDECSMIDEMLLDHIIRSTPKTKVLFVGDPAQLPPVTKTGETGLSPVFSVVSRKVRLEHIVRQAADNPILALSATIRSWIDKGFVPSVEDLALALPSGPSKAGLMSGDVAHAVAFEHKEGRDTRILCYTNRKVIDYNRRIHQILHPGDPHPFLPGQIVVFQSEHRSMEHKDIRNNEEVEVLSVAEGFHPKWSDIPAWKVEIAHPSEGKLTVFHPLHPEVWTRAVDSLFNEYRRLTKDPRDRDRMAEGRYASTQAWALRKAFADIRPTYAQTVHKSQGSTFHTVFIDWNDLLSLSSRSKTEFLRMLYTAVTRPAEHLAICH